MSLINEALKRAKQAQDTSPPGPGLEFRPVDPGIANHRNQRVMLLATMGVVVLLAVLLIWQMVQTSRASRQARVAERAVAVANAAAAEPQAASPVAGTRPEGTERVAATIIPQGAGGNESKPSESPRLANTTPAVSPEGGSEPQAAVVHAAAPAPEILQAPKPAPKLQSIIFNPKRPSAMISGRIVLVGDKFGDWRITGIDQESATLVANGVTNVLVLPQ